MGRPGLLPFATSMALALGLGLDILAKSRLTKITDPNPTGRR
jgi:hypothetical protein